MNYITLSLVSIIGVSLVSIFISFWVSELADKDAHAINLSGSMRMQTYRLGLAMEQGHPTDVAGHIQALDDTWKNTLFDTQRILDGDLSKDDVLSVRYHRAYNNWIRQVKPTLTGMIDSQSYSTAIIMPMLELQVALTDQLVTQFQIEAEQKIRYLRTFLLLALFTTVVVGSLIYHLLKSRIERPLAQLTDTAHKLGQGEFHRRVDVTGKDELGLLGEVFNQMSESIERSYGELENRVEERTRELHRNNVSLKFLFDTARKIIDNQDINFDFQKVVDDLAAITELESLELCLFTSTGEKPYFHIAQEDHHPKDCSNESCAGCLNTANTKVANITEILDTTIGTTRNRFPITKDDQQFGVLNTLKKEDETLDFWQLQLIQSVADQFAIALSMAEQKNSERRLATLNERTVIARELHDSLAQSLSYLQIQATRLQKSYDKKKFDLQQPIIDELREGLSSAYRQLRELLTTFRLKVDSDGLKGALESTVTTLVERSNMEIKFEYLLNDLPLNPTEEIHLLQIVREASQNAIHHSEGTCLLIHLKQLSDNSIELVIDDDGVGMPDSPEKLNHYGLAIMNERSRQLGGEIKIRAKPDGGTQVKFQFVPSYLSNQATA